MAIALFNQPQGKTHFGCQICKLSSQSQKIKKGFLRKKERVKRFSIFITMLSLKKVESNYGKKEPCK